MPKAKPEPPPADFGFAILAWNLMGGIDYAALPVIAEKLGIDDVSLLIDHLVLIRNSQQPAKS